MQGILFVFVEAVFPSINGEKAMLNAKVPLTVINLVWQEYF
jgi:hypothetical protein